MSFTPPGSDPAPGPWGAPVPNPPSAPGYGAPPNAAPYPSTGYGPPPGWNATAWPRFESLRGLTNALVVLFAAAAVLAGLGALAFFHRATVADDFLNNINFAAIGDLRDADGFVSSSMGIFTLVALAIAIVMIVWQHRYVQNAQALRGRPLGLASGWAVGGWFIPLGNFVLPGVQLGQAAKASDPTLAAGESDARGSFPGVIIGWAILFDLAFLLFLAATGQRPSESDIGFAFNAEQALRDFASADRMAAAAMVLALLAALAALLMVRQLSDRQQRAIATRPPMVPGGMPAPVLAPTPPSGWGPPPPPAPPPAPSPGPPSAPPPTLPPWTNEPGGPA